MVFVLSFNSDDPSSKPAEAYSFAVKILFEKNDNKQKEAGIGPFLLGSSSSNLNRGFKV